MIDKILKFATMSVGTNSPQRIASLAAFGSRGFFIFSSCWFPSGQQASRRLPGFFFACDHGC